MGVVTFYESPLGRILLLEEKGGLAGAWFAGQKYFPALTGVPEGDSPVLDLTKDWLDRYFGGLRPQPRELPLTPAGSAFQRQVWSLLREIPYGQTVTYGALARELAALRGIKSMSAQAVGGAVGRNPISVIIPCHRVVGTGGRLTGYAGGLERKQWLLDWEQK